MVESGSCGGHQVSVLLLNSYNVWYKIPNMIVMVVNISAARKPSFFSSGYPDPIKRNHQGQGQRSHAQSTDFLKSLPQTSWSTNLCEINFFTSEHLSVIQVLYISLPCFIVKSLLQNRHIFFFYSFVVRIYWLSFSWSW